MGVMDTGMRMITTSDGGWEGWEVEIWLNVVYCQGLSFCFRSLSHYKEGGRKERRKDHPWMSNVCVRLLLF